MLEGLEGFPLFPGIAGRRGASRASVTAPYRDMYLYVYLIMSVLYLEIYICTFIYFIIYVYKRAEFLLPLVVRDL